jgi:CRP/FNR family cyclic AMP-dependent transcriptional regulator
VPEIQRRHFLPGTPIFTQGDEGDCLYFVEEGRVRIWRSEGGKTVVLAEVERGGLFGEMALIDDQPRSANATAVDETFVQMVPGVLLKVKLERADPFLRKLINILTRNLRQTTEPLPRLLPQDTFYFDVSGKDKQA